LLKVHLPEGFRIIEVAALYKTAQMKGKKMNTIKIEHKNIRYVNRTVPVRKWGDNPEIEEKQYRINGKSRQTRTRTTTNNPTSPPPPPSPGG